MTLQSETARNELNVFRRRRTPEGRLRTYCKMRSRHFFARQAITIFCFVVFTQMTTFDVAISVFSLVVFADVLETLVLYRIARRPMMPERLAMILGMTALLAAVQALSIVFFVAMISSIGGGITRSLAVAVCIAALIEASLQLPFHRAAALTRLGILTTTLIGVFTIAFLNVDGLGTAAAHHLVFDLVAVILLMAVILAVLRNMSQARQRSSMRQALALEKANELADTAAALSESRQTAKRLAAIAEQASDSIIVTDPRGFITWVNAAFTEVFGYTSEEVIGQHVSIVNGPETDPEAVDTLMTARREAKPAQLQIQNRHKDGHGIWMETRLSPVLDADGRMTSMIAIERDIEHIKAREAALAEASRVKQAFLATVSHELRTPMNGIIGNAEMLIETPLSAEQSAMVRTIGDSGEALLTIVNDILDFSALEAGRLSVTPAPFAPRACLESVAALLRPVAARKGISFELVLPGELPALLVGDAGRIRQILSNLVGNAVKFTENGGVRIVVEHAPGQGVDHLEIRVEDTGIGIADDRLADVFDSFTQAHTGISSRFGGTGLGLAISRQLAQAMGGHLAARSTEGVGSVFTLELALEAAQLEDDPAPQISPINEAVTPSWPRAPEPAQAALPTLENAALAEQDDRQTREEADVLVGRRILIADDKKTNRRLLAAMLKDTGAVLSFASTGTEAVKLFFEEQPDVILMDMRMPDLDGLEATHAIRRQEAEMGLAPAPVIALTANALSEDRAACSAAGMTGFLAKPVRRGDLITTLTEQMIDAQEPSTVGPERQEGVPIAHRPAPEHTPERGPSLQSEQPTRLGAAATASPDPLPPAGVKRALG